MIPTDPDTGPIERSNLVKANPHETDRYVGGIDRLHWSAPIHLAPGAWAAPAVKRSPTRKTARRFS